MKTEWDYTSLANAYLQRPDYSEAAVGAMLSIFGAKKGQKYCDVGAGVAHLTLMLAKSELLVTAVEPNDAMRKIGADRTIGSSHVTWKEGTGEDTKQPENFFDAVTFGSSFNVCERLSALEETARILKPGGWFACMWNHRYLEDPTQAKIEGIISKNIVNYDYGVRRQDQSSLINESDLFKDVIHLSSLTYHEQTIQACIDAWKSHATLERQALGSFETIVSEIATYLEGLEKPSIIIPYHTNIWLAQLR